MAHPWYDYLEQAATILGGASTILTAVALMLPKSSRVAAWCAKIGVDLKGVLTTEAAVVEKLKAAGVIKDEGK